MVEFVGSPLVFTVNATASTTREYPVDNLLSTALTIISDVFIFEAGVMLNVTYTNLPEKLVLPLAVAIK